MSPEPQPTPRQDGPWIDVSDFRNQRDQDSKRREEYSRYCCTELEHGRVLFLRSVPFELPEADRAFLLSQRQGGSPLHKNISYRPSTDRLNGTSGDTAKQQRLREIMRSYSQQVTSFVSQFLPAYSSGKRLDYASFRTIEERGRAATLHKRNDLLHVDSFPTRPTFGARILRVFTNLNPREDRVWRIGEPFHVLAPTIAEEAGLTGLVNPSGMRTTLYRLQRFASQSGFPIRARSSYDRCMLHLHDWLKENARYQSSNHMEISFPPGSTWLVFTDGVPHAVLSGRYALEQTYIIPQESLVAPEVSPLRALESLAGKPLTN